MINAFLFFEPALETNMYIPIDDTEDTNAKVSARIYISIFVFFLTLSSAVSFIHLQFEFNACNTTHKTDFKETQSGCAFEILHCLS